MLHGESRNSTKREYTASFVVLTCAFIASMFCAGFSLHIYKYSFLESVACIFVSAVLSFIIRHTLAPWFYRSQKEHEENGKP